MLKSQIYDRMNFIHKSQKETEHALAHGNKLWHKLIYTFEEVSFGYLPFLRTIIWIWNANPMWLASPVSVTPFSLVLILGTLHCLQRV